MFSNHGVRFSKLRQLLREPDPILQNQQRSTHLDTVSANLHQYRVPGHSFHSFQSVLRPCHYVIETASTLESEINELLHFFTYLVHFADDLTEKSDMQELTDEEWQQAVNAKLNKWEKKAFTSVKSNSTSTDAS